MKYEPTYEELKQRVQELGKQAVDCKQALEALMESQQNHRLLAETMNHGLAVIDEGMKILYVNKSFCQMLGYSPNEMVGQTAAKFHDEANRGVLKEQFAKRQRGERNIYEIVFERKGKKPVPLVVSPQPIFDKKGRFRGSLVVITDITERKPIEDALRKARDELEHQKEDRTRELLRTNELLAQEIQERRQAEEALGESEERYRTLVETMNEGLAIIDEQMVLTYVNNSFREMLGYTKDELEGRLVTNLVDETNRNILIEEFEKRRNGERKPYQIVWTGKHRQQIPAIIAPEPILDDKGGFKGSFAVITDISELKQVERSLKEREKELEIKTINLEETNTALRVLLKRREEDKIELGDKVLSNVRELVTPYLEKLKKSGLNDRQKAYADILQSNLNNIISSFSHTLSSKYLSLTPTEIQVANLIKQGKSTKDIAALLHLSGRTICYHRENIRSKIGIKNKKANLRTYLQPL